MFHSDGAGLLVVCLLCLCLCLVSAVCGVIWWRVNVCKWKSVDALEGCGRRDLYMMVHFPFSAQGLFFLSGAWMSGSFFSFSSTYSRILWCDKTERKKERHIVLIYIL